MWLVNEVIESEFGYQLEQMAFETYEEAVDYAEKEIAKAEEEFGSIIDRDTNVYAVLTNHMEDWNGFIEITNVVLPSKEDLELV